MQRTFLRLKEAKYYSGATLPRLVAATVTVEISAARDAPGNFKFLFDHHDHAITLNAASGIYDGAY